MLVAEILFCGQACIFICDRKCNKAWGISNRMKIMLSDDEDDFKWFADDELGEAPIDPGTSEGFQRKPFTGAGDVPIGDEIPNKWCVRECERGTILDGSFKDFSVRVKNRP